MLIQMNCHQIVNISEKYEEFKYCYKFNKVVPGFWIKGSHNIFIVQQFSQTVI